MKTKNSFLIYNPHTKDSLEFIALKNIEKLLLRKGYNVDHYPKSFFYRYIIFCGTIKLRLKKEHIIKFVLSKLFKNFIVLESPVIGRSEQNIAHTDLLFRVGVNGFFANKGFEYALRNEHNNKNKLKFLKKFVIDKNIKFYENKPIGISIQIQGDKAIKGFNQINWLKDFFSGKIINKSFIDNNKFILRTPPLLSKKVLIQYKFFEDNFSNVSINIGTNSNKNQFFNSINFLITFSSTMGIDALVRGIPSVGIDSRSFLRLVSNSDLLDCFNSVFDINSNYLNILCNTTWFIDDLDKEFFYKMVFND